ncbi:IPT/TIG domain-containing protein [Chitinophaga eiseniae]|uniref:IPT/TIG domain-containing protein n=1 Tax=Chitinophaga eiseniae TaxID=634771 RepID=A0A1T4RMP2_9BACT|nr:IPT/TIG domain-containing protein [Chitinophaga eiseniae]SKA17254.1 IPT/TIG domain-containing protein [Chitinophaga eiseniae]
MKHYNTFVVALMLLVAAMTACSPNQERKEKETATVTGNAGNFLIIRGHGFSKEKEANKVIFGDVVAHILRAEANYLLVQVPEQKADTVQVVVAVGANTSNAMLFEYNSARKLVASAREFASVAY